MKKAASFISHLRGLECHEKKRSLNEIHGENDTVPLSESGHAFTW